MGKFTGLSHIFDGKNPWVSCKFSLKPIQWVMGTVFLSSFPGSKAHRSSLSSATKSLCRWHPQVHVALEGLSESHNVWHPNHIAMEWLAMSNRQIIGKWLVFHGYVKFLVRVATSDGTLRHFRAVAVQPLCRSEIWLASGVFSLQKQNSQPQWEYKRSHIPINLYQLYTYWPTVYLVILKNACAI